LANTVLYGPSPDAAARDARSILFGNDTAVYVGNGQFWRQGTLGSAPIGPL
jgi:hypothetical protein